MQLHRPRTATGPVDWKVTVPSGRATVVKDVLSAIVDEKTGTLYFLAEDGSTIEAFARGFWAHVERV
jgi:hypothetical protein